MCKRIIMMTVLLVVFSIMGKSFASEIGVSGTCTWTISDYGVLTISPTNGINGVLESSTKQSGSPFSKYSSLIRKVVIQNGVSAGTECYNLFGNFSSCTEMDVTNLDTSNVTNMAYMFYGCLNLEKIDVSKFDTSKVTDMNNMFAVCDKLTNLDLNNFDTSNVTNMSWMFHACKHLINLDLSAFNTSMVEDMNGMFSNCYALNTLNVSNFNTSKVTNMNSIFELCQKLTTLDVSKFDTSSVTDMNNMFDRCSNVRMLDVSRFNTSKVKDMGNMFSECEAITSLDLSHFDTANVENMSWMFVRCSGLNSLELESFNTSKVANMNGMFEGCSNLVTLDLSGFDTTHVTNVKYMFGSCTQLKELDISNFNTLNVIDKYGVFYGCSNLEEIKVGRNTYALSMPNPPSESPYTGKWINVSNMDSKAYTSDEIYTMSTYSSVEGTWIWEMEEGATLVDEKEDDAVWSHASSWAKEELYKAEANSLIPNIFINADLSTNITRKEFAHVVVKLYEKITGDIMNEIPATHFIDTKDVEVIKAYELGITNGTSRVFFSPDELITREQMATMMTRALKKAGMDTTVTLKNIKKFADDNEMHDWAKASIYYMSSIDIINGIGENNFDALGNATREQALLISERSAENLLNK